MLNFHSMGIYNKGDFEYENKFKLGNFEESDYII